MNETQHIASTISQGEKEIGAGNEIRTRECRYLRAFDAFMICSQAVEFNSFLLKADHKRLLGIIQIRCERWTKRWTAFRILVYLESNPLFCRPSVIRPEYAPALSGALKGAGLIKDCTGFLETWRMRLTPIPVIAQNSAQLRATINFP